MKSIVELINELMRLTPREYAQRFDLGAGDNQQFDFENWLRRCQRPGHQFQSLDHAYEDYVASFG